MPELTVENKNGVLVIDSRLIAEELGIENRSLIQTLDSYLNEMQEEFGAVTFEMLSTTAKGSKQRVAFLNEEQATFLMTLSRNTKPVVNAKIKLVKAFTKAKTALQSINPELLELFSNMTKQMNVLTTRTQRLDAIDKATEEHKGIAGIVETEVEELYPETLAYTVKEYLHMKRVSEDHLHTMRKRAVMFASQGKQTKLPLKGKEYLFVGNDISYLDQALKTVLGLD